MSLPLLHPFTCMVAGPTGSGKTRWTFQLIENAQKMIEPPPQSIVYCYGVYQHLFDQYRRYVNFHQGLPDVNSFDGRRRVLLIIDDLMSEVDDNVANIFTRGSHHKNISVVFLVQNMFHKNKHMRTISLNTHYMVLYRNVRDASQINALARQMYPNNPSFLISAYKQATDRAWGYLLLDFRGQTSEELRVRTNIFPGESHFVFVPETTHRQK